jgi:hypothetical protein
MMTKILVLFLAVAAAEATSTDCSIDYSGSCPYAEKDNRIETQVDEAACLNRAQDTRLG